MNEYDRMYSQQNVKCHKNILFYEQFIYYYLVFYVSLEYF